MTVTLIGSSNNSSRNMDSFENPLNKSLEEMKIKYLGSEGQSYEEVIPALDKRWCSKNYMFTLYKPPPSRNSNGEYTMGSKEDWFERMSLFIDDLNFLLNLCYHRFWSEVVYNSQSLSGINSFLQLAPPFYLRDTITQDKDILKAIRKAMRLVFLVLLRLTREKESEKAWMKITTLGSILYNNFIISLPQLMEICLIYANDNFTEVTEFVHKVVEVQPKYINDIEKTASFINEIFSKLENQLLLIHGHNVEGEPSLIANSNNTLPALEVVKIILLMLDISYSLATFLKVYPPAASICHAHNFEPRIASFYGNTVPFLSRYLEIHYNNDEFQELYNSYQLKLNLSRHQLIIAVQECLSSCLSTILEERDFLDEQELKNKVDSYLITISDCLSADHTFVRDYNSAFPIDRELKVLSEIFPEIDSLKRDFILESVMSLYELPPKLQNPVNKSAIENGAHTSTHTLSNQTHEEALQASSSKMVTGVELQSLITEVKDILPHLGDGFVAKCLEHFNSSSADVINAVLENTLPDSLANLDPEMPIIPNEKSDDTDVAPERINVYDNDEFDIMTQDKIDTSRIHRGKRKEKYKNMFEMLDDKTDVNNLRETYTKLSLVECMEDVNQYEDEYDDTYDDIDTAIGNEGETEVEERRAFVVPRILQQKKAALNPSSYEEAEDWEEDEDEGANATKPDLFIENPADVRERLEKRWQDQRRQFGGRHKASSSRSDVVGKPKGQGQEKDVIKSREFKNTNKASRGNHNRRSMAAKKMRQGMVPL